MQVLADTGVGKSGTRTGEGAFEENTEFEASQHGVPPHVRDVSIAALGVPIDEFLCRYQVSRAGQGTVSDAAGLVGMRPGRQQPAHVEQWVTDGAHLPVDHCNDPSTTE